MKKQYQAVYDTNIFIKNNDGVSIRKIAKELKINWRTAKECVVLLKKLRIVE